MNTTDYVSYPIALALKKAGFDEPCDHYYTPEIYSEKYIEYPMLLWEKTAINSNDIIYEGERFSAPTLWQAQKWLREKERLIVLVDYILITKDAANRWYFSVSNTYGLCNTNKDYERYKSYESALSAGIEAALELIKKETS
ncbi:hypothetical protein [Duncaniella freteri]|mgnify:CR=1 FL=1|uniref:hypothetical protein n=1 Tax=Duncaniella freteri TaxID=2530391 RepID=UPI00256FD63A|nr:hypothetical protein [Duncaniella freteri]